MTTVHTPRLVLRPYRPEDWEVFRSLVQDSELMRRLSGALTSESARKLLDRLVLHDAANGLLGWAVTTKQDGEYCGHVFIHNYVREACRAELGFVLLKRFHGQGLATEMAAAACKYARAQLGCTTVSASVDGDNERSKAVLARIGMTLVSREVDGDGDYLVYSDATRSSFTVQPLNVDVSVGARRRIHYPASRSDKCMTENAQTAIIRGLRAAIAAHNEHHVFNIGNGRAEAAALEHDDARLSVALNLWEGWSDSAAHNWLYYDGMKADDWPRLALLVIDAIENDRPIDDPKLTSFAHSRAPSGLSRFLAWLRSMFGPMV